MTEKPDLGWLAEFRSEKPLPALDTVVTRIALKKPNNEFVQLDPSDFFPGNILNNPPDGIVGDYLLGDAVAAALPDRNVKAVDLYRAVTSLGQPFLWPVPSDRDHNAENPWNMTHRAVAMLAATQWLKLVSNREAGCYEAHYPKWSEETTPEPAWPKLDVADMMGLAFPEGYRIGDETHIAIQKIHGYIL